MVDELKFLKIPKQEDIIKYVETYKYNEPEIQRPLDFKNVKTIKKVAKPLQQYIEDIDSNSNPADDIIVGGSGAAYAQVKGFRKPDDLDLSTNPMYINAVKRHIISILKQKYKNITTKELNMRGEGVIIEIMSNGVPF